jgi:hypothetical protein
VWVVRCGIDGCMEHIPGGGVVRRFREVVTMWRPWTLYADSWTGRFAGRSARPERGVGLHQGGPLSPLLARGYRAIRYSDDIAIAAPDRGAAERALSDAAGELSELRLSLDPVKSQCPSTSACSFPGPR